MSSRSLSLTVFLYRFAGAVLLTAAFRLGVARVPAQGANRRGRHGRNCVQCRRHLRRPRRVLDQRGRDHRRVRTTPSRAELPRRLRGERR